MGCIGSRLSVSVDSPQMIGPAPVWEMKQISLEFLDGTVGNQTFVDEISLPVRDTPIKQTNLAIGIPPGMHDPCSKIPHAPRHRSRCGFGWPPFPFQDFRGQFHAGPLIGVDTENPVVDGLFRTEILLPRKSFPFMNDHSCSAL